LPFLACKNRFINSSANPSILVHGVKTAIQTDPNGEALLSDAKSRFGDDETLAINHLNEVLGFSSTSQAWYKKLQPYYLKLNAADKKLFDSEYDKLKKAIESVGITTNANASINFSLPLSTDPKVDKFISVLYNF
jgi:Skp family chaperone for outer membrane proteins